MHEAHNIIQAHNLIIAWLEGNYGLDNYYHVQTYVTYGYSSELHVAM